MQRYAVVGNPIAHSQSPQIHGLFAAQLGLKISYERLLAPLGEFAACVDGFFGEGGSGLNVTLPFKEEAARWCSELDASAAGCGAVNTIVPFEQGYRGFNTDGLGLVTDLQQNHQFALQGARVALLGAGGAAAGVLGPLLAAKPKALVLANRTSARARALANRFAGTEVTTYEDLRGPFDLVVNATSLGLHAADDGFAALFNPELLRGAFCYDMLYGPQASFSAFAEASGAGCTADGLGMLVEQAAAAFALWQDAAPMTQPVISALRRGSQ